MLAYFFVVALCGAGGRRAVPPACTGTAPTERNTTMELLERLCQTAGIAGREDRIRTIVQEALAPLCDEVRTDSMGSLIGLRKARGKAESAPRKIMLSGHMDEIGFMISHVDEKAGFLRFSPVGGFDPRTLIAQRVNVHAESGDLVGVIGSRPIHVLSEDELRATLRDMAEALTPGGVLVLQLRNFQRVLQERERFMSPQVHRSGEHERVFLRFYDYDLGDERLRFNMVRLQRRGSGAWQASVDHTWLRPWRCRELQPALERVGLRPTQIYGNLGGEPFEAATSSDLVIVAQCS